MRCPHCGNKLIHRTGAVTRVRINGPLEFSGGEAHSRCYWCKGDVAIPVAMTAPIPGEEERFTIPDTKA